MKKQQLSKSVTMDAPASNLLDQVLDATRGRPDTPPVPEGFRLLEAGPKRGIRVNRNWITHGEGKPFLVDDVQYAEVRILGASALACSLQAVGCGFGRSAHVETTAALLVKE